MRSKAILTVIALLLFAALLAGIVLGMGRSAQAQAPQQSYDLSWYTIDGGGHTWSSGGVGPPGRLYSLGGTIGQPDAGLLAGGDGPPGRQYTLGGGFWEGGVLAEVLHKIYLPLIDK